MLTSLNCFARLQKPAQIGGETIYLSGPESAEEGRLIGDAVWDDYGPAAGVPALDLQAAGSAVDILDGEGVLVDESYTFSAWIYMPLEESRRSNLASCGPSVAEHRSSSKDDDFVDDAYSNIVCVKDGELGVCRDRMSGFAGSGFFVDDVDPGWYHCVAVAEDETKFWINGRVIGSSAARAPPGSYLRRIGGRAPFSRLDLPDVVVMDESWRGKIADIRFFDRALKTDDVASLFATGALAVAAAHAPPLAPKTHRAVRAARARLGDALETLDDARHILDAATDILQTKCHALDVASFITAINNANRLLQDAAKQTAQHHGLQLPSSENGIAGVSVSPDFELEEHHDETSSSASSAAESPSSSSSEQK